MLATEVAYVAWMMVRTRGVIGAVQWRPMLTGGIVAGATMALTMVLLDSSPLAAFLAGGLVYVGVLLTVERIVSPLDVSFAFTMVRRRLPGRLARRYGR
jgi:hypothetical protein